VRSPRRVNARRAARAADRAASVAALAARRATHAASLATAAATYPSRAVYPAVAPHLSKPALIIAIRTFVSGLLKIRQQWQEGADAKVRFDYDDRIAF